MVNVFRITTEALQVLETDQVETPKERFMGDAHDHVTGSELCEKIEGDVRLVKVLEYLQHHDNIEQAGQVLEAGHVSLDEIDCGAHALTRRRNCGRRAVDPDEIGIDARREKMFEDKALPASEVENRRMWDGLKQPYDLIVEPSDEMPLDRVS